MSTIGAPTELAAYLRSQLAAIHHPAPPGGTEAPQRGDTAAQRDRAADDPTRAGQPEDLAAALARRVAVIDRQDPDRRRKAFRVFLESLMLEEWGAQLINDPGFYQLVEEVHAQMDSRSELRALMDEAADLLLAQPGVPSAAATKD